MHTLAGAHRRRTGKRARPADSGGAEEERVGGVGGKAARVGGNPGRTGGPRTRGGEQPWSNAGRYAAGVAAGAGSEPTRALQGAKRARSPRDGAADEGVSIGSMLCVAKALRNIHYLRFAGQVKSSGLSSLTAHAQQRSGSGAADTGCCTERAEGPSWCNLGIRLLNDGFSSLW